MRSTTRHSLYSFFAATDHGARRMKPYPGEHGALVRRVVGLRLQGGALQVVVAVGEDGPRQRGLEVQQRWVHPRLRVPEPAEGASAFQSRVRRRKLLSLILTKKKKSRRLHLDASITSLRTCDRCMHWSRDCPETETTPSRRVSMLGCSTWRLREISSAHVPSNRPTAIPFTAWASWRFPLISMRFSQSSCQAATWELNSTEGLAMAF
jgi:hypothetical protein